jgi:agmatine deiminase
MPDPQPAPLTPAVPEAGPPRLHFPAEWEPHERTLMGWPCRESLWGDTLAQARREYATVANAIAAFEPVTMIANPGADAVTARAALDGRVDVVELGIDDSWLRDSGPIYVVDADRRRRVALQWRFNAWGEKFPPWDQDATIARRIAEHLGDPVREVAMVLEGGAVLGDGAGMLMSTEQCLLAPNRNPHLSAAEIEATLCAELGAERVVWLGEGQYEDRDTDGHVDMIAALCPDGRVLLQTAPPGDLNHERGVENLERLAAAGLEAVGLPFLPRTAVAGEPVAVSYLNFYVANGAVIVPVSGADSDPEACALIGSAFPAREVVAVEATVIAYGGGGPHCITQQVPALALGSPA